MSGLVKAGFIELGAPYQRNAKGAVRSLALGRNNGVFFDEGTYLGYLVTALLEFSENEGIPYVQAAIIEDNDISIDLVDGDRGSLGARGAS